MATNRIPRAIRYNLDVTDLSISPVEGLALRNTMSKLSEIYLDLTIKYVENSSLSYMGDYASYFLGYMSQARDAVYSAWDASRLKLTEAGADYSKMENIISYE